MTSTATSTLSGRYYSGSRATTTTEGRGRSRSAGRGVARKRFEAARRAHERQDLTDEYLDRDGMGGVSVGALLAGYAAR